MCLLEEVKRNDEVCLLKEVNPPDHGRCNVAGQEGHEEPPIQQVTCAIEKLVVGHHVGEDNVMIILLL